MTSWATDPLCRMRYSYAEVPAVLNYLIRLHWSSDLTKLVIAQSSWSENACLCRLSAWRDVVLLQMCYKRTGDCHFQQLADDRQVRLGTEVWHIVWIQMRFHQNRRYMRYLEQSRDCPIRDWLVEENIYYWMQLRLTHLQQPGRNRIQLALFWRGIISELPHFCDHYWRKREEWRSICYFVRCTKNRRRRFANIFNFSEEKFNKVVRRPSVRNVVFGISCN